MKKIVWNKVTPLSRIIALALFVALPFIGFYLGTKYGETAAYLESAPGSVAASSSANAGSDYYANAAEWQTASGDRAGFTIAYPIDFAADQIYLPASSTDWRVGANGISGLKLFTLTVPAAFEPQTNFADATLTVGASADAAALRGCLLEDQSGGPAQATSSATVNGIQFIVFHSNGAGAGNYYETTSYRTLHAGQCYAVEYTIHSSEIMNYPSSYGLRPFDRGALTALLDRIIGTFRF